MKNTFKILCIALFFSSTSLEAAVFTVNNIPGGAGQYTQIASAIAAANAGDTLYLVGSPTSYGAIIITKSLTILGTGINPQKQLPAKSIAGPISMSNGLSDVRVKGLVINSNCQLGQNTTNAEIENCYFSDGGFFLNINCLNTVINNCIFLYYDNSAYNGSRNIAGIGYLNCYNYFPGCSNLLIQNCIFNGWITGLNIPGTTIQNNIFLNTGFAFDGQAGVTSCPAGSTVNNALIQNNIFFRANPTAYTSNCTFINNISYHPSSTFGVMPGTGNLDNTNPLFTNFAVAGDYFSFGYNFRLLSSSPGYNAGTDGKDIGFYGGGQPGSIYGEIDNVPVIREMNIQNNNVPQNGNVNVKVRSTKAR